MLVTESYMDMFTYLNSAQKLKDGYHGSSPTLILGGT